jgi:hypothetical protein
MFNIEHHFLIPADISSIITVAMIGCVPPCSQSGCGERASGYDLPRGRWPASLG